ncbi:ubiquitin-related domain-containing protein [Polychytrium aggregatum]|uniref:ubiquitin-related domain-containing protein n=1 Tax=Polychytrium aggregatum TaxID=110093 RepID=UPI0022FF0E13|nr:ubiquitin-related domain-containing protein [Polychytrium aggregatum]KAI9205777.1 ubiquitin-related domain-containing protein [Polychytrium aggregatum]
MSEERKVEQITLKVVDADGAEIAFKIKKNTLLKKLMDTYTSKTGKAPNSIRFSYDGTRISPEDTPESLEMEDGDQIQVQPEQTGGC